ncbi:MAG: hypothetical protein IT379_27205 [Deltaproteobacteria bacterium]|nr:hypothetical protein [Deltaproteobacteria bacterium]
MRFEAGRQLAAELFDLPSDVADLVIAPEGWPAVGGPVRHVIVAGRVVVEDGALVTADLEEIRRRAHDEAPRLWRRMEAIA